MFDEVGRDGSQANIRLLGLLAQQIESLVGVDAVNGHQHALRLLDGGTVFQGTLNGFGDIALGLEAGEVGDGAGDRGGEQVENLGIDVVER